MCVRFLYVNAVEWELKMTECRPAPRPRPNGRFARSAAGSRRDLGPGCEGAVAPQGPRLQAPREESPPRQRSTSERWHRLPLPGAARPRLQGRHGGVGASPAVKLRKNLVLRVFSEAAVPCPVCVCCVLAFSASLQGITVELLCWIEILHCNLHSPRPPKMS